MSWLGDGRDAAVDVDGHAQSVAIEVAKAGCIDRATISLLKFLLARVSRRGDGPRATRWPIFTTGTSTNWCFALDDPDPRVKRRRSGSFAIAAFTTRWSGWWPCSTTRLRKSATRCALLAGGVQFRSVPRRRSICSTTRHGTRLAGWWARWIRPRWTGWQSS